MSVALHIISSGSQGNNYILDCNGEKLIIELGVQFKRTLKVLNYNLDGVAGCCVSHIHHDHSAAITNALSYGLKVLAPRSVCMSYPNCMEVVSLRKYKIGGFTIIPLEVHHNCECMAYVIDHKDMGRLVFYTDTRVFNYHIPNVNYILGEVNYSDDVILDNLCEGRDVRSQYENHMSLDTAINVIRRLYSPKLSKVICCHLSDSNADENAIKRRFKEELGLNVLIAESGLAVNLSEDDF